jgi:hypothetical protein
VLRTKTSSCDAQEAAGWVGGSLYNMLMIHGQDLGRGLSSAEVDGMETGSPCRVFVGPITEYPIMALVPSFVRGFNCSAHLISSLLSSPHRRLSSGSILQRVCGPLICITVPTLFAFFLLAGPSQDMRFGSLRHQQY